MLGVHDIIILKTMGVKNCWKAMRMTQSNVVIRVLLGYNQNIGSFDIIGIPILNLTRILTKDIE